MTHPKRLLAKSSATPDNPRPGTPEWLRVHTALVIAAAKQLLVHRGRDALRSVGLSETLLSRLERLVLVAAFIHDLGKCSDHFQDMIRWLRKVSQLVSHEACSLYLTWPGQPLGDWVGSVFDDSRDHRFAVIVAASHHRRFSSRAIASSNAGAGVEITCLTSHPDFEATLRCGKNVGITLTPPSLSNVRIEHGRRSQIASFLRRCEEEITDLDMTVEERRLLAVAKALVLDADVAGSVLPQASKRLGWIGHTLAKPRDPADLESLVSTRLGGQAPRPFQIEVASSTCPVTFVRAGCGSGKTVAAYLWAARSHPGRCLWVTYPTTGTATEGFRDYIQGNDILGRLEHGRANVDIDIFGLDDDFGRASDRLDALRAWGMDVVTCTTDTVLGLVQNQRKGMYAFASLCRSAVVFDEIHAYDDALFGSLLRFLRDVPGVPALLMTASLPDVRLQALQGLVRDVHGCDMKQVDGPPDLERLPRYRRLRADPWEEVKRVLSAGGKVLWVSNTVDRCISLSNHPIGATALIYHSRFRYEDRVRRHGDVIKAFASAGAAFAITTQVAEMSLDISADLLITDIATIAALIQRLGRLNRRTTPENPWPVAPFIVLEPSRPHPYSKSDLDEARAWLDRLGGADLSQHDLVQAWEQNSLALPQTTVSAWVDGVFHTEPAALRQAGRGITIVLEQDMPRLRKQPGLCSRFAVPMNSTSSHAWKSWPRANRIYPIAPAAAVEYDPLRGARWRKPT